MSIRFRSRFAHATLHSIVSEQLLELDWRGAGRINFATAPVAVIDYQPEERGEVIKTNTVAVSLGDLGDDVDEEMGASAGGLRSVLYPLFLDIYMSEAALAVAIGDDLRDIFALDTTFDLIDQITRTAVPGASMVVEYVRGPERPETATGAEAYKRNWRVVKVGVRLYYQT